MGYVCCQIARLWATLAIVIKADKLDLDSKCQKKTTKRKTGAIPKHDFNSIRAIYAVAWRKTPAYHTRFASQKNDGSVSIYFCLLILGAITMKMHSTSYTEADNCSGRGDFSWREVIQENVSLDANTNNTEKVKYGSNNPLFLSTCCPYIYSRRPKTHSPFFASCSMANTRAS